jgi:hypothetical protein
VLARPSDPDDEGEVAPTASPISGISQSAGPAIDIEISEMHVQEQEQQQQQAHDHEEPSC